MPNWSYINELDAFEIYHQVQENLNEAEDDDDLSLSHALRSALLGATGTAFSNLAVYPLDLICTRLQVQSRKPAASSSPSSSSDVSASAQEGPDYDGVLDAVTKIYTREGGLGAFYNGIGGDTVKSVVDAFLFFFAYNVLWRSRKTFRYVPSAFEHPALQALDGISVGVLAGGLTKAITTPIANVVTRQQIQKGSEEQSAVEIIKEIYDQQGLAGFWTGYPESLVLTLNPALTFFFDAATKRVLNFKDLDDDDQSALVTFLVAAIGKTTANLVTYPFKLAKARAQVRRSPSDDVDVKVKQPVGTPPPGYRPTRIPKGPVAAVAHIAQREGLGALYAGVGAELLKGFFSHGLTMLIKEQLPMFALNLAMAIMRLRAKYRKRIKVKAA